MIECPESCELLLKELLKKLVAYKIVSADFAQNAKTQFIKFLGVAKQEKQEFINFDKREDRLDKFLWKHVQNLGSSSDALKQLMQILLILSHGQAQVERGFSVNKQLLVENMHPSTLKAQRLVNDHMKFYKMTAESIEINSKMIMHVKMARTRYENERRERAREAVKSERDLKLEFINKDIDVINKQIVSFKDTIESMRVSSDEFAMQAEKAKPDEMKVLITKSNALKRAAVEKKC